MNVCDCSVVDTANHKQIELSYYAPNEVDKVLEIRRIRISGSDQWLAQLLMLIGKVAAKRLMYQTNQLYYCDSNTLNLFPYKLTIKKAD